MFGKKRDDKKINFEKVNEILFLSSNILKVAYVLIIILGVYALTLILQSWNFFFIVLRFLKILSPFFIGVVIAWLFDPLADYLKKKGIKRTFGTLIILISLVLIMSLTLATFLPLMKEQIDEFVKLVPSLIDTLTNWIASFFSGFDSYNDNLIQTNITKSLNQFGNQLTDNLPNATIDAVTSFVSGLGTFIIGLIIGFYLLLNFDKVSSHIEESLPVNLRDSYKALSKELNSSLRNFVSGTVFTSIIVFIFCFIGFALVGLKSPMLFALICGITNLIPYVGPYIGGFPAFVVGFTISFPVGLLTLLIIVLVQFIEGFIIRPMVMSKAVNLHPVTIIIGIVIFGNFFGIMGMLLATPIIATFKILFNFINNKFKLIQF